MEPALAMGGVVPPSAAELETVQSVSLQLPCSEKVQLPDDAVDV
jgi:hypothetical protein